VSTRPFRFGVIVEVGHDGQAWLDGVRRAEDLGNSTLLIRDQFGPDFFGRRLAPFSALMAAAAPTRALRVGTLVSGQRLPSPRRSGQRRGHARPPVGRLELGPGAGWLRKEYAQTGLSFDPAGVRVDRLEAAILVFKGLLASGAVDVSGATTASTASKASPSLCRCRIRPSSSAQGARGCSLWPGGRPTSSAS
jgi:alkanesulfonate monooxygenase SsuD/methylene tetrahydromethanopterin reductase-like flavin-dependent oxidoreductase (luciferase family)